MLAFLRMGKESSPLVMAELSLVGSGGNKFHCDSLPINHLYRFSSHGKQKGIIAAEFAEKKLSALGPSIEKQNEALATYSVIETAQNISRYK